MGGVPVGASINNAIILFECLFILALYPGILDKVAEYIYQC